MIVKDTFLNKLREAFSLNIYEVKVWTALLSRGVSTAGELSDIGNVPRSRTYDVLESLEKKGFIIMKLGKPIKYIAIKPEEIVKRIKKQIKDKTDVTLDKLEKVKKTDLFNELKLLHSQGVEFIDPTDLSGSFRGRDNVYNQINTMLSEAKENVVIVTTSDGLKRKANILKRNLKRLKDKKINVRIVAPINKENVDVAKELSQFAEIRNTQRIDARFLIVDNKDVMFMVLNDNEVHPSYDVGVWVKSPFFSKALESLFNVTWNKLEDGRKVIAGIK